MWNSLGSDDGFYAGIGCFIFVFMAAGAIGWWLIKLAWSFVKPFIHAWTG